MIRATLISLTLVAIAIALIYRAGQPSHHTAANSDRTSEPLTVLCAAGLSPVMTELRQAFEAESADDFDVNVDVSYKGSAQLIALHRIARTGDLLIAADTFYHHPLAEQGLCSPPVVIAHQTPCLIIADKAKTPDSLENALLSGKFRTSIPKREHAAIGRMIALVEGVDRYDALAAQATVTRETVSQVAADVAQGIADIGIAWSATAFQFDNVKNWNVDAWRHHRSSIGVSVLASSKRAEVATAFSDFMASEVAKSILRQHGYLVDDLDPTEAKP